MWKNNLEKGGGETLNGIIEKGDSHERKTIFEGASDPGGHHVFLCVIPH